MGEFITQDPSDAKYVPASTGMDSEQAKAFAALAGVPTVIKVTDPRIVTAQLIADQTGKTVAEVLLFMGSSVPAVLQVEEHLILDGPATLPARVEVPVAEIPDGDKFIVTEVIDIEDASYADLDKLAKEEDDGENNWSGKIREGSKVKIVYQVSASRMNWVGKKGKVVRVVGNEAAKVFDVEFSGGKIPKIRLNKKTGKLERGYEKKVIRNTFSEDQLELTD